MSVSRVTRLTTAFSSGHNLSEEYAKYVEHAVNRHLASLGRRELRDRLILKGDELRRTFTLFPAWALSWLPAFAWTALRLEVARTLPLKSFAEFTHDLLGQSERRCRRARRRQPPRAIQ